MDAGRDTKMLWAPLLFMLHQLPVRRQMTVPCDAAFDPAVHLCLSDVAVDDNQQLSLLQVTIKMDLFRKGVVICIGCTGTQLCPVAALLDYLCSRGTALGPLFVFAD